VTAETALSAPQARDGWIAAGLAAVVRLAVVLWAAQRFPPVEDGHFYHVVAGRIAAGHGYTWLWPDGAVTYAAHYPVGYPAAVGALYAVFGGRAVVAMALNALLGALAALAAHRVAATVASRRGALVAGLAVALHPALVLYTPALMTEGVAASLVALAAALAVGVRTATGARALSGLIALGLTVGAATLVRPQLLLMAPLFALVARPVSLPWRSVASPVSRVLLVSALAVTLCLPWTYRNCQRMDRCLLVSANGGWNLLIGTAREGRGSWVPLERAGVPARCRAVFGEAEKDACFASAALERIVDEPLVWLSLVPHKLANTFDYAGAAGWYLHTSSPDHFPARAKVTLGVVETVYERTLLVLAALAAALAEGPRRRLRWLFGGFALLFSFTPAAWIAHLALLAALLALGRKLAEHPPAALAASLVGMTALTHAVFFGAGRYSLVIMPLLAPLAACVVQGRLAMICPRTDRLLTLRRRPGDTDRPRRDA
jgi:hypothetical protein